MSALTEEELTALRRVSSPTVANAVETFRVRPRSEGVTRAGAKCFFPEYGTLLGYACTATIMSGQPAPPQRRVSRTDYWHYTRMQPGPKVTVVQDLSSAQGGAYWGEVNANIHLALGSLGVITNGLVRDLPEVQRTGFHLFAGGESVSHGYAHLEDYNRPVEIFGMTVNPGDLIHADRHGAVVIPLAIARELAAAAIRIEREERVMIDLCRSKDFSIEKLDKLISPEY